GARTNSWPSVSIANFAPYGRACSTPSGVCDPGTYDHEAHMVVVWPDARGPQAQALVELSANGGDSWSDPQSAGRPQDSTDFPAIAISPNGEHLYLTYDAFLDPTWQEDLSAPRKVRGVTRAASFAKLQEVAGTPRAGTAWQTDHIAGPGDARAS